MSGGMGLPPAQTFASKVLLRKKQYGSLDEAIKKPAHEEKLEERKVGLGVNQLPKDDVPTCFIDGVGFSIRGLADGAGRFDDAGPLEGERHGEARVALLLCGLHAHKLCRLSLHHRRAPQRPEQLALGRAQDALSDADVRVSKVPVWVLRLVIHNSMKLIPIDLPFEYSNMRQVGYIR